MKKINWGIIGCGDVTEVKSGPAFNKVKNSALVAVMRRDASKAKDYALRHNVPVWYDDGLELINNVEVNAVYIATPPSSHEEYVLASISAGKSVYVEKPMTLNYASALRMLNAANENKVKLSIAHYRRAQPFFKRIKELLEEKAIGEVRVVQLSYFKKSLSAAELQIPGNLWRVDEAIAGGGLFHDLAPHQLDLMYYFFGEVQEVGGISFNQAKDYNADDVVSGNILFKNGVLFSGLWSFNIGPENEKDQCEITGTDGKISFSVFGPQEIIITKNRATEIIAYKPPQHVQQPMIEKVVTFFLGDGPNPCSAEDGAEVMRLIDKFTSLNV
jgi:predicted dehydrogenase